MGYFVLTLGSLDRAQTGVALIPALDGKRARQSLMDHIEQGSFSHLSGLEVVDVLEAADPIVTSYIQFLRDHVSTPAPIAKELIDPEPLEDNLVQVADMIVARLTLTKANEAFSRLLSARKTP